MEDGLVLLIATFYLVLVGGFIGGMKVEREAWVKGQHNERDDIS
jgi:hypothetical protein